MKSKIKWFLEFAALSAVMGAAAILIGNLDFFQSKASTVSAVKEKEDIVVVIDAGHGGEDGGCVGIDGTLEKDLNLAVSLKVYGILNAAGIKTEMTRYEDKMTYDMYSDLSEYEGKKKTYDLKNRVRFAKESDCDLFVSIHMNKFSDEKYSGLQVYHSPNASDSITAALRIQKYVRDYLQPENEREIKKAGSNIYILNRSQMPSVLVECGFLSNPKEAELLKEESYQQKLSLCIASGIVDALCNFES